MDTFGKKLRGARENKTMNMRQVIIYTSEKNYSHFLELAKNLQYVKKIVTDEEPDILDNIKAGLEEVLLFNKGELKTTSAKDFLHELQC